MLTVSASPSDHTDKDQANHKYCALTVLAILTIHFLPVVCDLFVLCDCSFREFVCVISGQVNHFYNNLLFFNEIM